MANKKNPEVTVVVTNYNYKEYLEQAIDSVLNQTYENLKLIIIDDASTDGSDEIFKRYTKNATIISHKKNKGVVFARNKALDIVKSKYILFLDADDWLNPDYVEMLVDEAEAKGLDVAYCGMQYFIDGKKGMNWIPPEFNLERLKNENYIHMSSLIKTKSIDGVRFDKGMERLTHEDWDFFLSLALMGLRFGKVTSTSLNYRFKSVSRNLTDGGADEKFASLYKYLYEKHNNEKPGEVGYLAYYRFVKSFLSVNSKLNDVENTLREKNDYVANLEVELASIKNSKTYKLSRLMALPVRLARAVIRKIRTLHIRAGMKNTLNKSKIYQAMKDLAYRARNKRSLGEKYFIAKDGSFAKKSNYAVVLHLYYTENWAEIFLKKLIILSHKLDFDLYVTMPEENIEYGKTIRDSFPAANILIVPNRGRDVLPFIKTAQVLKDLGYKKLLKLHSKKSTHRDSDWNTAESGDSWLLNTLDALIPEDGKTLESLIDKLKKMNTGMVGASEYYYPLKMYLKNNRAIIERIMNGIDSSLFTGFVSNTLKDVSYFGGTMFWVNLEDIGDVLSISKNNFQDEKGQTDATVAHALERIFCILPQIKGKDVYAVSGSDIVKVKGNDSVFPAWYFDDISGGKPQISVIVPVYSDWSSLSKNISSLKKIVGNSEDISVHYVNDCGPEADTIEQNIIKNISGLTNFYYYRNDHNLGFVQTCNRSVLELVNQSDDVLLLNSDTKVTNNFIFEMRKVLYSEWNIGAVTSRSNNATIWSVPMSSKLANYRWASYVLYRFIKRRIPEKYITPTIHGFCVLIRREVINRYGMFDEVYGKGYGEENDFAMRLRKHGWLTAVANRSFVFHYESRSFGNEVRNRQIEMNEKILIKRYPEYRQLVQEYWDSIKEPLK